MVLGVDVGTTNTKAALVQVTPGGDPAVRELAVASTPTPDDARELLAGVGAVVRQVLDRWPDRPPAAVGIASMAETGVPLDRDGAPLTGLLRWDGHRAGAQAAGLVRTHGAEALFAATGVRAGAKVPLATWAWLADQGVRLHHWAGAADLVALALSGRLVTDHTLAGRTMAYRVTGRLATAFDASLLDAVGLRPEQLPEVVPADAVAARVVAGVPVGPSSVAGSLQVEGLPPGTPVVVAGHDHAVGAWAAGARRPGTRGDSLGTAEAVLTTLETVPTPAPVARAGMSWVRTPAGGHGLQAGSSSAGAMLDWLEQHVASRPDALREAARLAPADRLVVLPYPTGRQTPSPDPAAAVRVVDLDGRDLEPGQIRELGSREPGRLAHAVLLGVCLQARWMLDEQTRLGGTRATGPLLVLGGAARSVDAWARTKQRVTPDGVAWVLPREPVATGAALLAAARSGLLGAPEEALHGAPTLDVQVLGPGRDPVAPSTLEAFVRAALRS